MIFSFLKNSSLFNPGIFHDIDFCSCVNAAKFNTKNRYCSICSNLMTSITNTSQSSPTKPPMLPTLSNTIRGVARKRDCLHSSNHRPHLITYLVNAGMQTSCSSCATPWHTISMPNYTCVTTQEPETQLANDLRFGFSSNWGLLENNLYNEQVD